MQSSSSVLRRKPTLRFAFYAQTHPPISFSLAEAQTWRPHQLEERSKRRSGRRERVRSFDAFIDISPHRHFFHYAGEYRRTTHTDTFHSQGQGQPRCHPRQSDLRQTEQRCPIIPPHHSRRAGGQIKDQRLACTQSTRGSSGSIYTRDVQAE
jgi:hypothetical protein